MENTLTQRITGKPEKVKKKMRECLSKRVKFCKFTLTSDKEISWS